MCTRAERQRVGLCTCTLRGRQGGRPALSLLLVWVREVDWRISCSCSCSCLCCQSRTSAAVKLGLLCLIVCLFACLLACPACLSEFVCKFS
jgi:hypothetical protein